MSSICFYNVFNFIPVLGSIPVYGFLSNISAVVYNVQTYALKEGFARFITLLQPSASLINPYLIATLPHSANLSNNICYIFVTYDPYMSSRLLDKLNGDIVVITPCNSLSI